METDHRSGLDHASEFRRRGGIDRLLIEKARQGDRKSQEILLSRHEQLIFDLIMRILRNRDDAMDALQDTMVKAIINLGRYDPKYDFGTWLMRIATTTSLDILRKRRREANYLVETGTSVKDIPSGEPPIDTQVANRITVEAVERAMGRLTPKYRTVLLLRYRNDLSYNEIADTLSVPVGTVKILLHRAHKALKRAIRGGITEEGF